MRDSGEVGGAIRMCQDGDIGSSELSDRLGAVTASSLVWSLRRPLTALSVSVLLQTSAQLSRRSMQSKTSGNK